MPTRPSHDLEWPELHDPSIWTARFSLAEPQRRRSTRSIPDRVLEALSWLARAYLEGCAVYALSMYPLADPQDVLDPSSNRHVGPKQEQSIDWVETPPLEALQPQAFTSTSMPSLHRPTLKSRLCWPWRSERRQSQSKQPMNVPLSTDEIMGRINPLNRADRIADLEMF